MKKALLIALGTILILLVLGVWVYLLMFGTPETSGEVFARFGIGETLDVPRTLPETSIDVSDFAQGHIQRIKQITTRPVAGATFVGNTLLYVEQGTGHVYQVDRVTGTETILNGSTFPGAREAIFSPDGSYLALTTYDNVQKTHILSVTAHDPTAHETRLPDGASSVSFNRASNTVLYILSTPQGSSAYTYDPETKDGAVLFTTPLRDIRPLWGDTNYIYTIPSAKQIGYLYNTSKRDALSYVTSPGYALSAIAHGDGVVVAHNTTAGIRAYYKTASGTRTDIPVSIIPEKCISYQESLFCALPTETIDTNVFPDTWYQGVLSFSDALWKISPENGSAEFVADFLGETGREIDVKAIGIDAGGAELFFINKNDNTLWAFDLTL